MSLINTTLFDPRNFVVTGIMAIVVLMLIQKFSPRPE